jgi:phosphoglycerate dehydrogenase-like enzyme
VGLIGWGASARAFAVRLVAAGATALAWSEHASPEEIERSGARPASLSEALAAEIVSLHRGLTPATRHFLGPAELARLRPGSTLINLARGALVEPQALLARLRQGDVFACLDSFEDEPLPASHPLRRSPNVFLTSHIAGGSSDLHAAAAREVLGKIARQLDGEPADAVVRERLRTMT